MSNEIIEQNSQMVRSLDLVFDYLSINQSLLGRNTNPDQLVQNTRHSVQIMRLDDDREVAIIQQNTFTISRIYTDGRPDGKRPQNHDSYFDYFCQRLEKYKQAYKTDQGFTLTEREWKQLLDESYDRYIRYLLFSSIKRWEDVQRDTDTNLQVLDLVRRYADENISWQTYQYKGYILMMNSIARAELALVDGTNLEALQIIDYGIQQIGKFCAECLREEQGEAENVTREHYLSNLIEYRSDMESIENDLDNDGEQVDSTEQEDDTIIQELEDLLQEMAGNQQ
ncbi:DNA helicase UvrBC [Candidatus Poribacteria bacterium]|nr:DNA helicase UvrBC [Candidatus Poribacteria bacterium]